MVRYPKPFGKMRPIIGQTLRPGMARCQIDLGENVVPIEPPVIEKPLPPAQSPGEGVENETVW